MKVGVVVLCRYSSSRLYGKILKKIEGKEVLQYICEKVVRIKNIDEFCVATSDKKEDDAIEEFCNKKTINIFRGSLNNVSERFYNCAEKNDYDVIIRINGDNIFLDITLVEKAIELFLKEDVDFLSNVKDRTYPKGMSVEIVKKSIYKKYLEGMNTPYLREHVMPYFYENSQLFNIKYMYHDSSNFKNVDLALDTQEDFILAKKIIKQFTKAHWKYNCEEIVELYKKEKI